jgi:CheY-like chemotaxis protein
MALSANAMPRDIEKGLRPASFAYLTKPIKVPQFMATLDLAALCRRRGTDTPTKARHDHHKTYCSAPAS